MTPALLNLNERLETNETISKGDVVRLEFTFKVPYFRESQFAALTSEVEKDGRFLILASAIVVDRAIFTVQVVKDPVPLLILIGVFTAAGALVFFFLQFEKAERMIKAGVDTVTAGVEAVSNSVSPLIWGAAAVLALWYLGPFLRRVTA